MEVWKSTADFFCYCFCLNAVERGRDSGNETVTIISLLRLTFCHKRSISPLYLQMLSNWLPYNVSAFSSVIQMTWVEKCKYGEINNKC